MRHFATAGVDVPFYRSSRCDAELRDKLVELAREKPRFANVGCTSFCNGMHKRVWRVYRAAGLCVKRIASAQQLGISEFAVPAQNATTADSTGLRWGKRLQMLALAPSPLLNS